METQEIDQFLIRTPLLTPPLMKCLVHAGWKSTGAGCTELQVRIGSERVKNREKNQNLATTDG